MSKRRLLLVVFIFVLHLAPTPTLAEQTNSDGGCDLSLQGLGSGVSQPDTVNGNDKVTYATVVLAPDAGSKSDLMLPRMRRRRAATTNADNTSTSLVAEPSTPVQSIVAAPRWIIGGLINWIMGMIGNLTGAMMTEAWKVAKNFVIPELDKASMKIVTADIVPEEIKTMIISAHSAYTFMKIFGYMKPE